MDYLLQGIVIGLLFGLPVGAVGAMTVQRTWNNGIRAGLFTGLGSSAADCFYAAVGIWKMFVSSFAVGITNPAAILTFLFAFSYFGISAQSGPFQGIMLVGGVFIGTYVWWGTLTAAASIIKKKMGKSGFRYMNRIFGMVLCLFGAAVLLRTSRQK